MLKGGFTYIGYGVFNIGKIYRIQPRFDIFWTNSQYVGRSNKYTLVFIAFEWCKHCVCRNRESIIKQLVSVLPQPYFSARKRDRLSPLRLKRGRLSPLRLKRFRYPTNRPVDKDAIWQTTARLALKNHPEDNNQQQGDNLK
jgi:hypothetical protein